MKTEISSKLKTVTAFGGMAATMGLLQKMTSMDPAQISQLLTGLGGGILTVAAKDQLSSIFGTLKGYAAVKFTAHLDTVFKQRPNLKEWVQNEDLTRAVGQAVCAILTVEADKYPAEKSLIEALSQSVSAHWEEYQSDSPEAGEPVQDTNLSSLFLQPVEEMLVSKPISSIDWLIILRRFLIHNARTQSIKDSTLEALAFKLETDFSKVVFDVLAQPEHDIARNKAIFAVMGEGFDNVYKAIGRASKDDGELMVKLLGLCDRLNGLAEKLDIQPLTETIFLQTQIKRTDADTINRLVRQLEEEKARTAGVDVKDQARLTQITELEERLRKLNAEKAESDLAYERLEQAKTARLDKLIATELDATKKKALIFAKEKNIEGIQKLYRDLRVNFGLDGARLALDESFYLLIAGGISFAGEALLRILPIAGLADKPKIAEQLTRLSLIARAQGKNYDARRFEENASRLEKEFLPGDDYATAAYWGRRGHALLNAGDYFSAEPFLVAAYHLRLNLFGPEHPDTLLSMNNLAGLYKSQGLYAQAEPLYVETLRLRQQVLRATHPETLISMNNLATLYDAQGRFALAEPLYIETLRLSEQVLGAEHPSTLKSKNNLAALYKSQGRYSEAEPLYVETLHLIKKVLGAEHPDTLNSMGNLAAVYDSQELDTKAEPLYVETLRLKQQVLGAEHPNTLLSQYNLAIFYNEQSKPDQCAALLREVERLSRYLDDQVPIRADILDAIRQLGIQIET